jgi:polyisoprenyl-phosphate glycosyltransferase
VNASSDSTANRPATRTVSVVTPVFEDLDAARMLFADLASSLGPDVTIVAVDDGSVVHPLTVEAIRASGLSGTIVRLKRNVGHQRAIAVGLAYAADSSAVTDRIVVMDSDGEDQPSTVPQLLRMLDEDGADVVVAERRNRSESVTFRLFYRLYRGLFILLTGRRISFGNFMAMRREAMLRVVAMGELAIHVPGTILLSRLRWKRCPLDRGKRYASSSKMNFVGLALHGFRGLMVFAEDVLVRVGAACALVAALSVLGITTAIVLKSIGYATPGWFSVALGILVLMFLQTGAITLMTLMLTGVVRSTGVLPIDYRLLIATVESTERDRTDG